MDANNNNITRTSISSQISSMRPTGTPDKTARYSGHDIKLLNKMSNAVNSIEKTVNEAKNKIDHISMNDIEQMKSQQKQLTKIITILKTGNDLPVDQRNKLIDTMNKVNDTISLILLKKAEPSHQPLMLVVTPNPTQINRPPRPGSKQIKISPDTLPSSSMQNNPTSPLSKSEKAPEAPNQRQLLRRQRASRELQPKQPEASADAQSKQITDNSASKQNTSNSGKTPDTSLQRQPLERQRASRELKVKQQETAKVKEPEAANKPPKKTVDDVFNKISQFFYLNADLNNPFVDFKSLENTLKQAANNKDLTVCYTTNGFEALPSNELSKSLQATPVPVVILHAIAQTIMTYNEANANQSDIEDINMKGIELKQLVYKLNISNKEKKQLEKLNLLMIAQNKNYTEVFQEHGDIPELRQSFVFFKSLAMNFQAIGQTTKRIQASIERLNRFSQIYNSLGKWHNITTQNDSQTKIPPNASKFIESYHENTGILGKCISEIANLQTNPTTLENIQEKMTKLGRFANLTSLGEACIAQLESVQKSVLINLKATMKRPDKQETEGFDQFITMLKEINEDDKKFLISHRAKLAKEETIPESEAKQLANLKEKLKDNKEGLKLLNEKLDRFKFGQHGQIMHRFASSFDTIKRVIDPDKTCKPEVLEKFPKAINDFALDATHVLTGWTPEEIAIKEKTITKAKP